MIAARCRALEPFRAILRQVERGEIGAGGEDWYYAVMGRCVGDRRASALMEEIGIAASRRLKGLGVHQRAALLAKFGAS